MAVNPNVDERRYDFPWKEATTPGETRLVGYTVREKQLDGSFINASTFASYTDWEMYCFEKLGDGGIDQASRQTAAIFYIPIANINVAAPPLALVTCSNAKTALVTPGLRFHELWAKVSGEWTRLSYGDFPFVA